MSVDKTDKQNNNSNLSKSHIYSKTERLQNNIIAINNLLELTVSSTNDISELEKFNGFGGLSEILINPFDEKIEDKNFGSKKNRDIIKEIYNKCNTLDDIYSKIPGSFISSFKNSVNTAYYTPKELIKNIFIKIKEKGFLPGSMLDPSAGNGVFYESIPKEWKQNVFQIEKDLFSAECLKYRFKETKVYNKPFEKFFPDKYDLIASNIPFGNIRVYDKNYMIGSDLQSQSTMRIHNYFIMKSLDSLNDKGLLVFLMPTGVMDSEANEIFREELAKNGNIITVLRLPNSTFLNSGTEVVSDLLIYQKDNNKKNITELEKFFINGYSELKENGKTVKYNSYFEKNIDNVLGKPFIKGLYGDSFDLKAFSNDFESIIELVNQRLENVIIQNVDHNLKFEQQKSKISQQRKKNVKNITDGLQLSLFDNIQFDKTLLEKQEDLIQQKLPINIIVTPENNHYYYEGSLCILDNVIGATGIDRNGEYFLNPLKIKSDNQLLIIDFIALKNKYLDVIKGQTQSLKETELWRNELNYLYDNFYSKYGSINENSKLISEYESRINTYVTLEKIDNNFYLKGDIFFQNTIELLRTDKEEQIKKESSDTYDLMMYVLNEYGNLDMRQITRLTGKTEDECFEDLKQYIFKLAEGRYELKEIYLSGDVLTKIKNLEQIVNSDIEQKGYSEFKRNLDALNSVKPYLIPFEDIHLSLGQRWIPEKLYELFVSDVFQTNVDVLYKKAADTFFIKRPGQNDSYHFGYRKSEIIQATMNSRQLKVHDTFKDELGKTKTVLNVFATRKVQELQAQFNIDFTDFISKNAQYKNRLTEIYNDKYNRFVKRKYDGSVLKLNDINHFNPFYYQKDSAYMITQNNGNYTDHCVGAGKSLTMVIACHELKRLKIANKPAIVAIKSTISDIAAAYRRAYPKDNILVADDKNFTTDKRQQFFSQIANGNYDCIIMSHDNFGMIPQDKRYEIQVTQEEIERLEADLIELRGDENISKRLLRGLEIRKEGLMNKLNNLQTRKESTFTFQSMGIDHLMIDEAHKFKNLSFTTRLENVSGLGSQRGSQRSHNLLVAIRSLQDKYRSDKGVTFLSGTPISNSMTEMYSILKYLRPKRLEEMGLISFDAWQKQFSKVTTDYELSVTGDIKLKTRLSEFCNLPELCMLYSEIADVRVENDILKNIKDRPKAISDFIEVKPTEEQLKFNAAVQVALENLDWTYLQIGKDRKFTEEEETAKMLLAANLIDKMSLDLKLISREKWPDFESPKIECCVERLLFHYNETNQDKGTQLVFCDKGVPKSSEFNVYQDIKDKLIKNGITEKEIAFIHDAKSDKSRRELFAKVNEGKIRILIGSTEKMGTGVNVQSKVVAMHHLDTLWRPSDFKQRIGRGERQGNELGMKYGLKNYVYGTEKTLDAFKFNILAIKDKFIEQLKKNEEGKRYLNDSILNDDDMSFNDYVARLSGDNRLIDKAKLEKKIDTLIYEKKETEKAKNNYNFTLQDLNNKILDIKDKLQKSGLNISIINSSEKDKDGKHILVFKAKNGLIFDNTKDIGNFLKNIGNEFLKTPGIITNKIIETGCTVNGFNLVLSPVEIVPEKGKTLFSKKEKSNKYDIRYFIKSENSLLYSSNRAYLSADETQLGIFIRDALHKVETQHNLYTDDYNLIEGKLKNLTLSPVKEFSHDERLNELKKQYDSLLEDLRQNPPINPLEEYKIIVKNEVSEKINSRANIEHTSDSGVFDESQFKENESEQHDASKIEHLIIDYIKNNEGCTFDDIEEVFENDKISVKQITDTLINEGNITLTEGNDNVVRLYPCDEQKKKMDKEIT